MPLPPIDKVKAISAKGIYPIAIRENGTLMRWRQRGGTFPGDPYPGNIPVKAIASSQSHFMAIKEDGTVIQWGVTQFTQLPPIPEGTKAIDGACGFGSTVIIKEDGTLAQFGGDITGFPQGVKVKAVACGNRHFVGLKEDDTLVQWGNTRRMQMSGFPAGVKVKDFDCVIDHSSAIKEDGTILQWGNLNVAGGSLEDGPPEGLLGKKVMCDADNTVVIKEDDTMAAWGRPLTVSMVPTTVKVKDIAGGGDSGSFGIKEDGTILEWGVNEFGNYPDDIGADLEEDDDALSFVEDESEEEVDEDEDKSYFDLLEEKALDTPTPNPFPDYAKRITVEELPKKTVEYTSKTMVFDPVMQSDVSIQEALEEKTSVIRKVGDVEEYVPKSILVKVGDTYSALDRDYIGNGIDDGSLIRYACTKELALFVGPKDVYGKNPFLYLKGLGSGNFMVLFDEYLAAQEETAIELVDTGIVFPHITSMKSIAYRGDRDVFGRPLDLVGADHCQAGSQQKLYKIVVLDMVQKAGRRKTRRIRKNKKKTRKQK